MRVCVHVCVCVCVWMHIKFLYRNELRIVFKTIVLFTINSVCVCVCVCVCVSVATILVIYRVSRYFFRRYDTLSILHTMIQVYLSLVGCPEEAAMLVAALDL